MDIAAIHDVERALVAIARKSDAPPVGRNGGSEIARRVIGEIDRVLDTLRLIRPKRDRMDIGVAGPRADEEQGLPIRRERGLVLHDVAVDQQARRIVAFQLQGEKIRRAVALGGENHPSPVRRQRRRIVQAGVVGQSPRLRARFGEMVDVAVRGLEGVEHQPFGLPVRRRRIGRDFGPRGSGARHCQGGKQVQESPDAPWGKRFRIQPPGVLDPGCGGLQPDTNADTAPTATQAPAPGCGIALRRYWCS
ncbi:MAG: hypothetical protein RQ847_10465 [Wenzhouxiangellaceae bacterium]|nr:hypothetical protein [Wenzhouxiangellaceae bacterium]